MRGGGGTPDTLAGVVLIPVAAALALVVRGHEVLLIRRRNPPDQDLWSCPGGRIEVGETVFAAAERELLEETGVRGLARRLLDAIDVFDRGPDGTLRHHFILLAIACEWLEGDPIAADDALDAKWFVVDDLRDGDKRFSADVGRLSRIAVTG